MFNNKLTWELERSVSLSLWKPLKPSFENLIGAQSHLSFHGLLLLLSLSLLFFFVFILPNLTFILLSLQNSQQEQVQSPSLDDCLKLLRGERDEQRLAGLLLVTKFCKGDDVASLRKVYDAVGIQFLGRLLRTGILSSLSVWLLRK